MIPDYSRSFVRVPRDVLRALLRDHPALVTYLAVLDRARYAAGPEARGRQGMIPLAAGEAVFGRAELAALTGLTEAQIRGAKTRLQMLGFLAIRATSRGTIVTVCGYGENDARSINASPAESPTVRQPNDRPTANESPAVRQPFATNNTGEEIRDTDPGSLAPRVRAPARAIPAQGTTYDSEDPAHRGQLAQRVYRELSAARLAIAAELGLAGVLPFPAITPAARPAGFRALSDRIREEGAAAPQVCTRVLEVLIAEARERREVDWLSEKSFGENAWRRAREAIPGWRAGPVSRGTQKSSSVFDVLDELAADAASEAS